MKNAMYLLVLIASVGSLMIASAEQKSVSVENSQMKQSVTYLHLLKKTPFFTNLDKAQLKWIIKHSTEWEVDAGTEISNMAHAGDFMWILLDGGWEIEQGGAVLKAGHADPAKWYGSEAAALLPPDSKLIVNQHSYVMQIRRSDFEEMISRKFDFHRHLKDGVAYYKTHLEGPAQ